MNIKINSIQQIPYRKRLLIVADYIEKYNNGREPMQTKKGVGRKLYSRGGSYHVSCHKTKTLWVFKIWYG